MKSRSDLPADPVDQLLTRYEYNLSGLPIWAPTQRGSNKVDLERQYEIGHADNEATVTVYDIEKYGHLRPFDKIVLGAITRIWEQQGKPASGIVKFQIVDLVVALGRERSGKLYNLIKASILRLAACSLWFEGCFYDGKGRGYKATIKTGIIMKYLIIENKDLGNGSRQQAFTDLSYAQIDVSILENLKASYTRPVSLNLLQKLSEKGVLFEGYINSVLYRRKKISKDVFELWEDLGLSITGIKYASKLAHKMKADLDKIAAHPDSLLASYSFEKSKTRKGSQNLILRAKSKRKRQTTIEEKIESGEDFTDVDIQVERIRFELKDAGDEFIIRRIAERMPAAEVERAVYDALGRKSDGLIRTTPASYFVGTMKKRAAELNIDLGLKRTRTKPGSTPGGEHQQKPTP